jgi:hypothetical protein
MLNRIHANLRYWRGDDGGCGQKVLTYPHKFVVAEYAFFEEGVFFAHLAEQDAEFGSRVSIQVRVHLQLQFCSKLEQPILGRRRAV